MRRCLVSLLALVLGCGERGESAEVGSDDSGTLDADGDGFPADEDCDDADPAVHPDARETCDTVDNDCDGSVDEGLTHTSWLDADGDGWGAGDPIVSCERDPEHAARDGDCDDADPAVNPGEREVCDGVDQDCDGRVDLVDGFTDEDGDGHRGTVLTYDVCDAPDGVGTDDGDCDDADADVHPGAFETCDDWVDDDCDGTASCLVFSLVADDGARCTASWAWVSAHTWSSVFDAQSSVQVELEWDDAVYAEAEPDCGWPGDGFAELDFSAGLLGWPADLSGNESWDDVGYRALWVEETTLDGVPATVTVALGLVQAEVSTSDPDED